MFLALGTFTHSDSEFKGTFEVMSRLVLQNLSNSTKAQMLKGHQNESIQLCSITKAR
jgi:hypothetical protein